MLRWTKWMAPVAGVVLMLGLQQTQAQDKPTPAEGKATVTVTVVDEAGKPVADAKVSIIPALASGKNKGATTKPAGPGPKAVPLQTGVTTADGTIALTKIPDGAYNVTAKVKGQNGREKVVVADDKDEAVSITLKPRVR